MPLTLRAVSLNDQPLTQPITARFGAEGGTIGRADSNTMSLPDPERHISRLQAQIITSDAGYVITNVGSANPILVRGQPVARGDSSRLAPSDEVRIGGYLLEVVEEAPTPPDHAPMRAHRQRLLRAPAPAGALGELGAPLSSANPFATLLGNGSAAATPPTQRLPDDFDPFSRPRAPVAAAAAPVAFEDLVSRGPARSLDDVFGLQRGEHDPLAGFLGGAATHGTPPAPAVDPMAMFEPPAAPAPMLETASDHVPQMRAGYRPPRVAAPAAPIPGDVDWLADERTTPAEPRPQPAAAPTDSAALWHAFCEGAGVHVELPRGLDAQTMRMLGALLRGAVDGTHQMMMLRATTKSELGAEVTIIHAQNNNPFKFSPDGQAALEQLLRPPLRGFMPGPAAMTDAMHDLVSHAIATVAGMRAAMEGMLRRFAPDELEAKLSAGSVLDNVLPMNRRARLWRLYLQRFEALRSEAQDDFHTLFGRAFLAAYEQQLERLERGEGTYRRDAGD